MKLPNLQTVIALSLSALLFAPIQISLADTGRSGQILFNSAEEALAALKSASKAADSHRMVEIFGKNSKEFFLTGDSVNDSVFLKRFSQRLDQRAELLPVESEEYEDEEWYFVRFGIEGWNMRVPLVNRGKGWSFASEYATETTARFRIALNEIATVDTLRALVKAQEFYKSKDWNNDGVLEYASRFISTPGTQDGLYWPDQEGIPASPIDGLIGRAMQDGYKLAKDGTPTYSGYHYKILTEQGGKTRGGKKSYLKDHRLVNGFAILAYPVEWNSSGQASFLVASDAQVWKKNLNSRTESIAPDMTSMDLDSQWLRVDPNLGGKNSRSNW